MPEVFPSETRGRDDYPRLSEPRSRTETRYGEPTFIGTRERQIFRGQSSIGSQDPFRRRVEQTPTGGFSAVTEREKGLESGQIPARGEGGRDLAGAVRGALLRGTFSRSISTIGPIYATLSPACLVFRLIFARSIF